jgi:hypothetical protein
VEDDNPFAGLQKKSKKGRKADKHKAAEPTDKKINHSFDIMEAFSQLKVEAPVTSTKVGLSHLPPPLPAIALGQVVAKTTGTARSAGALVVTVYHHRHASHRITMYCNAQWKPC